MRYEHRRQVPIYSVGIYSAILRVTTRRPLMLNPNPDTRVSKYFTRKLRRASHLQLEGKGEPRESVKKALACLLRGEFVQ